MFCRKTALLHKKAEFLHKKAAFLQIYVFVKADFLSLFSCKKAGFVRKKAAFLQEHIFVKKQYFYNRIICKRAAFLHNNDAYYMPPKIKLFLLF